jgi:imidazolonepropionase
VTTVEVKSGYGLDLDTEARCLRAARRLARERRVEVRTTFLGAHALPPEAGGDRDAFIAEVSEVMLPAVAAEGLVDAVDAFCEGIAFSPAQVRRVFAAARRHGLRSNCTPTSYPTCTARRWPPITARSRPTTWSTRTRRAPPRSPPRAPSPCCCRRVLHPVRNAAPARRGAAPSRGAHRPGDGQQSRHLPLTSLLLAMNMGATLFRLTVASVSPA